VPTPVARIRAAASARPASAAIVYGSPMMPCCLRLTISTSRTCGSISPLLKPRSMMPMPPSSATAIAMSDRVTVSMFAETIGRFSVTPVEKRQVRSMADGSRRSTTLYCGLNRKSSNVAPRTRSINTGIVEFTNLRIYEFTNLRIYELVNWRIGEVTFKS
jgi:hypothetical protein